MRQIEEFLLPAGCTVQARLRAYTDTGVALAEFDMVIDGRFGGTHMKWLIYADPPQ